MQVTHATGHICPYSIVNRPREVKIDHTANPLQFIPLLRSISPKAGSRRYKTVMASNRPIPLLPWPSILLKMKGREKQSNRPWQKWTLGPLVLVAARATNLVRFVRGTSMSVCCICILWCLVCLVWLLRMRTALVYVVIFGVVPMHLCNVMKGYWNGKN